MTPGEESPAVAPDWVDHLIAVDAASDGAGSSGSSPEPEGWEGEFLHLLDRAWSRPSSAEGDATGPAAIGRYLIKREVGRGGFGVVYLARDPEMGRDVALKIPLPGMINSPDVRRRFTREALAVAVLDHPNIVPVHDAQTVGPVAYIVSTYCPGPSLAAWLKARTEPVPPQLAARWASALARGVEHAHDRGILHRDLKPANILLQPGGTADLAGMTPRLTDFGLAKLADETAADVTRTGMIVGSAPYMAPEQAASVRGKVGPATDVYALGATLYEMLVRRPPFGGGGKTQVETLQQVLDDEPIAPQLLRRGIPRDLQTICLHALRKNPNHRYATAAAFEADLERYLAGEPILARPASVVERAWRWGRRHPAAATLVGSIASVIMLAGLGMAWSNAQLRLLNDQLAREVVRADRHANEVDRHLHAARLNHARQAIEVGQNERAQAILTDTNPSFGSPRHDFAWRYLWNLSRRELAVWGHHANFIDRLVLAPDGATLASGDQAGLVQLWDVASGRLKSALDDSEGKVQEIAFTPDGAWLAVAYTATSNPTSSPHVTLWDLATGCKLARLGFPGMQQIQRLFCNDGGQALVVVVNDPNGLQTVQSWSLAALASAAAPPKPRFAVSGCVSVAGAPDGRSIWTTQEASGGLHQRDAATGQVIRVISPEVRSAWALACSPDGRYLAASPPPASVLIWDLVAGGPPRTLVEMTARPDELIFHPDAGALLVVSGAEEVRLVSLNGGASHTIFPLNPQRRGRFHCSFTPDGRWLVSSGQVQPGGDQRVTLWDVATGLPTKVFPGRRNFGYPVVDARSESVFLGNNYDIAVWHPFVAATAPIERYDDHADEVWSVAFSPDGLTLASGGNDDRIRLFDHLSGARKGVFDPHKATVSSLAWHPDGRTIAAGSLHDQSNLVLHDARSGVILKTLPGHTNRVRSVVFSPDGAVLASGASDNMVRLWDGATGRPLGVLPGHTDSVRGLAFERGRSHLASVSNDGTIRVWDWGKRELVISFHERYSVSAVAYSPDGLTLATADEGGFIHLRDSTTWASRRVIQSDDAEIRSLTFSPDGETLVSAGFAPTIRFWDPATGQPLMELKQGSGHQINHLAFSPDGTHLAAADHGGRVLVFHGSR